MLDDSMAVSQQSSRSGFITPPSSLPCNILERGSDLLDKIDEKPFLDFEPILDASLYKDQEMSYQRIEQRLAH